MDEIEIQVEVNNEVFSDELKGLEALKKRIGQRIKSALSLSARITLVEPQTLARSQGKAQHVIDNRRI